MNEKSILNYIQLALSKLGAVTFRNNTGTAYQGTRLQSPLPNSVLLGDPRPLHAGLCKGSSDLVGWQTVEVTPDMVGKRVAVFVAIEVKTPKAKPTEEQLNFLRRVQEAGGLAGIARSPEDAITILQGPR